MTSRSGRESLTRVQDRLALRVVGYLESLPDLTIRLEASDATSKEATTDLLRSIPCQLGGCMLLTVVLSDRTFAAQDDESFRKVFNSKTGACSVLDTCLPGGIAALDFFIPFSSVVGLFGNGGQTNYSRFALFPNRCDVTNANGSVRIPRWTVWCGIGTIVLPSYCQR